VIVLGGGQLVAVMTGSVWEVVKIAKPTVEISDKVRLNLEEFCLVESRKIAK
jgi:hypothetical protein